MTKVRVSLLCAAFGAGALLTACDKPINDGPHPPADSAPAAAAPSTGGMGAEGPPAISGGPAGQTPPYGQPGAAPTEVPSQPDGTGPSASDSSGSVR